MTCFRLPGLDPGSGRRKGRVMFQSSVKFSLVHRPIWASRRAGRARYALP